MTRAIRTGSLLRVLSVLLAFAACEAARAGIQISGVTVAEPGDPGAVPRYAKIELLVTLADVAATELYEPDPSRGGLDLSAGFTGPSGTKTIKGFYDGEAWRIRFAPDAVGGWTYAVTAKDSSGTSNTANGSFACVASASPGFARIDGRYLRLDSGKVLFAVGHNTGWQDGPLGVEIPSLATMAARGENLLSFWLATPWDLPSWGAERAARSPIENIEEGLGNYSQAACAYLDGVVARAEAAGVCLLPTIWSHGQLRYWNPDNPNDPLNHPWGEGWWVKNPYNTICSATNFFQTGATEQWRLQKNFYRYLIARWGYSRAVAGWVGLCEIDGTTGYVSNKAQAEAWCTAVRDYFSANDQFRAAAAGAYPMTFTKTDWATDWNNWAATFDLRATDSYKSETNNVAVALTIADETAAMRGTGKPCFHAEFGGNTSSGATQPTHLHNGTWAGTATGAALTPLVWCDGGSFPMLTADMQNHLQYLSEFMGAIPYLGDPGLAAASLSFTGSSTYTRYHRGWGMKTADRGFAWIQRTSGNVGGCTLNVAGLTPGSYTVTWFNVWTSGSTPYQTNSVTVGSGGVLLALIPKPGRADIACRFDRIVPNNPPVAASQQVATDEDASADITLTATDAEGDPLAYAIVAQPTHGSLSGTPPNVTYAPNADYNGQDSFTFKANDGHADSNVATVTVTVNPVNDDPVAAADSAVTEDGIPVIVAVLANDSDIDGDPLSIGSVGAPGHGSAADTGGGTVTYSPTPGFVGVDSFTYTVSDGQGGTDSATVTVTVNPVNHPPVATADSASVDEDGTLSVEAPGVLGNDSDPDGDQLAAVLVAGPAHGALTLQGDGSFVYTPAPNFNGADSFAYKATDGQAESGVATVAITVSPVNDNPVAQDDLASTDAGVPVAIAVLANDSDVDGDDLSVASVTQGSSGAVVNNGNGTVTYTPSAGFVGSDTFTYTVDDGHGGTATASVHVTVEPAGPTAVISIAMSTQVYSTYWKAVAALTVKDATGKAIASATVYGHWSGATSGNVSGTTSTSGTKTFTSGKIKTSGTVTFTVDRVTKGGQDYILTGQTSGSISGAKSSGR